jgi:phosphomannomutase
MNFFKAYDMRGEFGREFDLDTVYRVGRWLPFIIGSGQSNASAADCRLPTAHGRPFRVLVGRDARLSSEAVRNALCRGLTESGCAVDDMGLATTPMVYFFTAKEGYDASVQITASHNPANHNGLKVSRAGAVPVGYDTGLGELEKRVMASPFVAPPCPPPAKAGTTNGARPGYVVPASAGLGTAAAPRVVDYRAAYLDWLRGWKADLSGLRYAVDCSDGVAGLIVRELLGEGPVYLNDTPDGGFPNHSPNPLDAASREQLARLVREQGLDAGVIFDGDADRVMFVDESGAFVQPDYLIPVIARPFLAREPGAAVIHDVRTSRGAIEALRADGARPVMGKVGHAFAKVLLRETGAVCGGELAGHYYFRDFFCCDSGELAALLVLAALADAKRRGVRFSELIAPIRIYANSGECNYRIADKAGATAAVLAAAEAFGAPQARSEIDGVRLDYADGWFCVRQSNTEPYLRLIVEALDAALLAERLAVLEGALKPFAEAHETCSTAIDGNRRPSIVIAPDDTHHAGS